MRALSVLLVLVCGTAFAEQTRSPAGTEVCFIAITITVTR